MDLDYKKIGFRIGERRRELNIKQVELAEAIGISSKYLSNIEKGVKHASVETLFLLSNALNTTTDYFLLGNIRADIDENIIDSLKLCSLKDKETIIDLINIFAARNADRKKK